MGDAGKGINKSKDDNSEEEIRERTGQHDGYALGNGLKRKACGPLPLIQLFTGFLAQHLDVAPQRNEGHTVVRIAPLNPQKPGSKTQRETKDRYSGPLGHQEMTQFVDENQ